MTQNWNAVKDSGTREDFGTGAVRDAVDGKGRYDLIPPHAMKRIAKHYENGANKYGDHNWQKGIPTHNYINSALRHIFKYLGGMDDEDHLAAAAWNIMCLIQTERNIHEDLLDEKLLTTPMFPGINTYE